MRDIEIIIEKGRKFYKQVNDNENGRFRSWEHCYRSFHEAYVQNKKDEIVIDYLCLQLSFYLASWGMYRGSSFLLWLDYKVHEPVVKILLSDDYNSLWKMKITEDKQQDLTDFYENLEDLKNNIKVHYNKQRKNVIKYLKKYNKPDIDIPKNDISDTLVSKIILGTIGCTPAYDQYFISGVRNMKKITEAPGSFNEKSIKKLIEYYKNNYSKFEEIRKEMSMKNIEYPQMKVLDSCFWQLGFDIEDNK